MKSGFDNYLGRRWTNLLVAAFKTAATASIAVLFIGTAAVPPGWATSTKPVNPPSGSNSGRTAMFDGGSSRATLRGVLIDADLPPGYAPLGIVKIGGEFFVMLVLENGAKLYDAPGPSGGFADVFDADGHLIRRFAAFEHPAAPWQIVEYVRVPANTVREIRRRLQDPSGR